MRVNLKDNKKWATEESRRRKKKGAILASAILSSVCVCAGLLTYHYFYVENGKYYPRIVLEDAPTNEPMVYIFDGFEKMVKSPSLPYTMLAAGDVILDNDEYCIFLYQDAYYVMAETEAETSDVLKNQILPALGANVTGSAGFNHREGYLNNRRIETECLTFSLGDRGNLYTISYRLLLPEGRDIVITGISADVDVYSVYQNVEKIFYSIHEVTQQKEGITQTIDYEVVGNEVYDSLIGNIVVNMNGNDEIPMDKDLFPKDTLQSEIKPNPGGIHNLEDGVLYKSGEEKMVLVEDDFDTLAFVFSYGKPVELSSIELVGPSGDVFYPDERHKCIGYDYVFYVDAPMQGEWTFIWTAENRIGNYEGYYTKPQHYTPPADLIKQTGDRKTGEGVRAWNN